MYDAVVVVLAKLKKKKLMVTLTTYEVRSFSNSFFIVVTGTFSGETLSSKYRTVPLHLSSLS